MAKLCAACGEREVAPLAVEGRTSAFREFMSLPIPADLPIPTCARCGAEWYDRKTAERLDAALGEAAAGAISRAAAALTD